MIYLYIQLYTMKQTFGVFAISFLITLGAKAQLNLNIQRWQAQANNVTIIRDHYGIPHIYGKKDADAVFGLMYAQCEDDFARLEANYIEKLGRKAERDGDKELFNDLYVRLLIDSNEAKADYTKAPVWLQQLCNAFADGINYYLYKHPEVKPALITQFEPWFPLLWTDGSIGALHTASITASDVKNCYDNDTSTKTTPEALIPNAFKEVNTGSNGFAFGPNKTASGNTILYINPHTTFYFRGEVHMVSEEGLNVYGAVTWGQFFIYQGFNETCGWMHTSSEADVADEFIEELQTNKNEVLYKYGKGYNKAITKPISIFYKTTDGTLQFKNFNTAYTIHGPIMAIKQGKYISVKHNNRNINGLIQSWNRTKVKDMDAMYENMQLKSNTSNNTLFADNKGIIAYWHGNYIPVRNTDYDWSKPVDGTTPATNYNTLHELNDIVHVYNPTSGYIQNCNSTPYTSAGASSPSASQYITYMAPDGENFRGVRAAAILDTTKKVTIDKAIALGYDNYLTAFELLIPALIKRFDDDRKKDANVHRNIEDAINLLREWDYRCHENSINTTLAITWGEKIWNDILKVKTVDNQRDIVNLTKRYAQTATSLDMIGPMKATIRELTEKYTLWQTYWGQVNRIQRLNNSIPPVFNDSLPSEPIGFTSAQWGCLPSYNSKVFPNTKNRYGVSGNSFVCAVEFGKKVKAKSLLAGGQSSNPQSKHYTDQLKMYSQGQFKEVLFYKEDVEKHVEKKYKPGE
jgi:acyl-homoserine-lactone acylase